MQFRTKKLVAQQKFKRIEYNHPLNPFRITSDQNRLHLKHLNSRELNRGLINNLEKLLVSLQQELKSEINALEPVSILIEKLHVKLNAFSKIPCSANINTSIFEHLNHILQLLYDWQGYGKILQKIQADAPEFFKIVQQEFKFPQREIEKKVSIIIEQFTRLTNDILSEIIIVREKINKEQKSVNRSFFRSSVR